MITLIKQGHVVDPSQNIDSVMDIIIQDSLIKEITPKAKDSLRVDKTIEAKGMFVLPGLVDMHVHLREPGFEHKETIKTGTKAALRGGFTTVAAMPNTFPVNDNAGITEYIRQKAQTEGLCTVLPIGAVTKGQAGEELAEMGMMKEEGCVAFSDDGNPIDKSIIMRRALEYSKAFGMVVISHCEVKSLSEGGVMNEGPLSLSLGLKGIPNIAEDIMVYRDIALSKHTGGRLHIAHVSTSGSVQIIREAKAQGVNVTAETCPHYFTLTEAEVSGYNTNAKVSPPLRTEQDIQAIKEGLKDGALDVIATDHAPHSRDEKLMEFDLAPPGISGIETALSMSLALVHQGVLTLPELVAKMALNPSRILGIDKGTLQQGAKADIVIIDLNKECKVNAKAFESKGKNTPIDGWSFKGAPIVVIRHGKVYEW